MPLLLWDASALAKRYVPETGTDTVDALFSAIPASQMITTVLGYAETFSTLLRRRNRGEIPPSAFVTAKTTLRDEVVSDPDFTLLTVDDPAIFAGVALMEQHNLNATDAAILALFLRYVNALPANSPACVLVAADQRLVAAARAEGLRTVNPDLLAAMDVPGLLATL